MPQIDDPNVSYSIAPNPPEWTVRDSPEPRERPVMFVEDLSIPRRQWNFFGDAGTLIITGRFRISKWRRFWCWFFFGSTFLDLK